MGTDKGLEYSSRWARRQWHRWFPYQEDAMRKLRWGLTLAGLAVTFVAAATLALWPRADRITRASFDRICGGMSRTEVYAILGAPGDYTTGPTAVRIREVPRVCLSGWAERLYDDVHTFDPDEALLAEITDSAEVWRCNTAAIRVRFGRCGITARASYQSRYRIEQRPFNDLLWLANRQWHRWFP
jgi:hypothetical protein